MNNHLKVFIGSILIIVLLLISGCKNNKFDPTKAEEWLKENIPETIYDDYKLPTSYEGFNITWESDNVELIDEEGNVTNPTIDEDVTLTYTIFLDDNKKVGELNVTIAALNIKNVEKQFLASIPGIIYETRKVKDEFKGYTIEWSSSNEDVFSNQGVYTKQFVDSEITITYKITNGQSTIESSATRKVRGYTYSEKVDYIANHVIVDAIEKFESGEHASLPETDDVFGSTISWNGLDFGQYDNLIYGKKLALTATILVDGYESEEVYYMNINAKKDASDLDNFLNMIAIPYIDKVTFEHTVTVSGVAYHYDIDRSYNYLPFYVNLDYNDYVTEQLAVKSYNGRMLTEVKFITIHDSAMVQEHQNAKLLADVLTNGQETSWHFSVGDTGAYNSIPLNQVAYHAGDGSAYDATLYDTGVKATTKYPVITIGEDGYYYFNAVKSKIVAPTNEGKILKTSDIVDSGLYSEIGKNGNYYITQTWYSSSYRKISNHGGNMSSIGIESCVNKGSDYRKTLFYLSKLVANLCIRFNLTTDNLMQHNNFSGKECPRAIRYANYWNQFKDLVALEMVGQKYFANYTFAWTSLTPDLLADDGKISLNAKPGDTLRYKVSVTNNVSGEVIEKEFATVVR